MSQRITKDVCARVWPDRIEHFKLRFANWNAPLDAGRLLLLGSGRRKGGKSGKVDGAKKVRGERRKAKAGYILCMGIVCLVCTVCNMCIVRGSRAGRATGGLDSTRRGGAAGSKGGYGVIELRVAPSCSETHARANTDAMQLHQLTAHYNLLTYLLTYLLTVSLSLDRYWVIGIGIMCVACRPVRKCILNCTENLSFL